MTTREGRNGGTLMVVEKGDPPLPGAGRKKKLPEIDDLLSELMGIDEGGEFDKSGAMEVLNALFKRAKRGDTRAAEILLDRAFGKVPSKNEHTGKDGGPIEVEAPVWVIRKAAIETDGGTTEEKAE